MSKDLDTQITKELESSIREHSNSLNTLMANYNALTKLRNQLPFKFLMKDELKAFLLDLSKRNLKTKQNFEARFEKLNKELEIIRAELQKELPEDKKSKLVTLQARNEKEKTQIAMELDNYKKVILEVTPEREMYFYEDLVLFVSNCKHEALDLWKYSIALYESMEADSDYFNARFFLEVADDALRDKGFGKVTEALREHFLNSKGEIRNFKKVAAEAVALKDSSKKLVDAFESDEVNFRRFFDKKLNLVGM